MSTPAPFTLPLTEKFAWYVWQKFKNEPEARWHRTCWEADTMEAAVKLREVPLYHTDFHAGIPQQLVRETTWFDVCERVVKPADGYHCWTNGVPDPFHLIGVGFGTRVTWLPEKLAWVKGFADETTATVCAYPRNRDQDAKLRDVLEEILMPLNDFVANLPTREAA